MAPRRRGTGAPSRHDTLASSAGTWHGPYMTSVPNPTAGGVLIALGALAGAVIGVITGQPTLGFLAGTAIGIALAFAIWWRER